MGRALSEDLRNRVVQAWLAGGESQDAIAARFSVSRSTVQAWLKLYRTAGNCSNRNKNSGRKPVIATSENIEVLRQIVVVHPDLTYDELADAWSERIGVKVSRSLTVRHTLRLGFKSKKVLSGDRGGNTTDSGTPETLR